MLNNVSEKSLEFKNASLEEAIQRLNDLKSRRKDIILPIQDMKMNDDGVVVIKDVQSDHVKMLEGLGVDVDGEYVELKTNEVADEQISGRFDIPRKYWQRMMSDHPELAAQNFNGWINKEVAEKGELKSRRMLVRSYLDEEGGEKGVMRALLSDRYLVYDNLDMLAVALQAVMAAKEETGVNIQVDTVDLSERRMYVRFIVPEIEHQASEALKNYRDPDGGANGGLGISNGIVSGFVLKNSEVGNGALAVSPRVVILACRNGMVWKEESFKRTHLGGKMSEGEWSQETHRANITLIEEQMRDQIRKFVDPDYLGQKVKEIEEMAARKLQYPMDAVNNFCDAGGFSDKERENVFDCFLKQGDTSSVFAVSQAMTSYAHQTAPDRREEIETFATSLMGIANRCDVRNEK